MKATSVRIGFWLALAGLTGFRPAARGEAYAVQNFDPKTQTLEIFRAGPRGLTLRDVQQEAIAKKKRLLFACNSGIFEPGFLPTGLHRDAAGEWTPLNLKSGEGNFYTKPNGVFYLSGKEAHILESRVFARKNPKACPAIQSGPLLLSGGRMAGAFSADHPSRKTRHGVGVRKDGTAVFVWAKTPVNLHAFAQWFQQHECRDALYLDGQISRFYQVSDAAAPDDESFAAVLAVWE